VALGITARWVGKFNSPAASPRWPNWARYAPLSEKRQCGGRLNQRLIASRRKWPIRWAGSSLIQCPQELALDVEATTFMQRRIGHIKAALFLGDCDRGDKSQFTRLVPRANAFTGSVEIPNRPVPYRSHRRLSASSKAMPKGLISFSCPGLPGDQVGEAVQPEGRAPKSTARRCFAVGYSRFCRWRGPYSRQEASTGCGLAAARPRGKSPTGQRQPKAVLRQGGRFQEQQGERPVPFGTTHGLCTCQSSALRAWSIVCLRRTRKRGTLARRFRIVQSLAAATHQFGH